jgi:hypothetical protein
VNGQADGRLLPMEAAAARVPAADGAVKRAFGASAPQNIIWIASYPKSGNTWVRPLLHNLGEEESADPADINRLRESISREASGAPHERLLGKPVTEASRLEIAQVRPQVQARLAASRPDMTGVPTRLERVSIGFVILKRWAIRRIRMRLSLVWCCQILPAMRLLGAILQSGLAKADCKWGGR